MMPERNNKCSCSAGGAKLCFTILICIALIFGIISYLTPFQLDDLIFRDVYQKYNNGSFDFNFSAWTNYIHELRANDNSRLSNIMEPFFANITPFKQIFPWLTGILVAVFIALSVHLSGYSPFKPYPLALMTTVLIVFLPWRNQIMLLDYSLNYIYTSAISLAWVTWLLYAYKQKWSSWGNFLGVLLTAPIAGAWHEGYALPIICGLALWTLLQKFRFSWQWYLILVVYLVSALVAAVSPGIINRFFSEVVNQREVRYELWKYLVTMLVPISLVISLAVFVVVKKLRTVLFGLRNNIEFVIFCTAALASSFLTLVVNNSPRTAFLPTISSAIALMILYTPWINQLGKKRFIPAAIYVLLGLFIIHGTINIIWQYRFNKEYYHVYNLWEQSPDGIVYYNALCTDGTPIYTLRIPQRNFYDMNTAMNGHKVALKNYNIRLLPTEVQNATIAGARPVGDSIYAQGNCLLALLPPDKLDKTYSGLILDIELFNGNKYPFRSVFGEVITSADGVPCFYVYTGDIKVSKIKSARFVKMSEFDTE